MTELERLWELERRLANLIRIGRIQAIDFSSARAKVVIGQLESSWLKWLTQRAGDCQSWWAPSKGEQVVLLSPCGELNNGVILPALFANNEPTNKASIHYYRYKDGTEVSYDYEKQKLTVNATGLIEIAAAKEVKIKSNAAQIKSNQIDIDAPEISIKGNLSINGSIIVSQGDVIADGKALKMHNHIGDSGGVTSIAK
ncbi:phage baseplate assembly protein V [Thiotrichales bacterium 19X7-9]|nr:phage baseplate assembly protein V [Thiotrichales bacterium 19X7-9]